MERLITGPGMLQALARAGFELRRAVRRFTWRFGFAGWAVLLCAAGAVLALAAERQQAAALHALQARVAAQLASNAAAGRGATPANTPPATQDNLARARLQAFDDQLLQHGDLPFVVKSLLELGEAEGLSMQRGTYRPQADIAGGFMRYQMSFPVKGSGPAIQRFMKAALLKQANLALDSVQFRRAHVGSSDVEARIQWVMLTRLPHGGNAARGELR